MFSHDSMVSILKINVHMLCPGTERGIQIESAAHPRRKPLGYNPREGPSLPDTPPMKTKVKIAEVGWDHIKERAIMGVIEDKPEMSTTNALARSPVVKAGRKRKEPVR